MTIKRGMTVKHPVHGAGTVSSVSPTGQYAVVQYPKSTGGTYSRTHASNTLEQGE